MATTVEAQAIDAAVIVEAQEDVAVPTRAAVRAALQTRGVVLQTDAAVESAMGFANLKLPLDDAQATILRSSLGVSRLVVVTVKSKVDSSDLRVRDVTETGVEQRFGQATEDIPGASAALVIAFGGWQVGAPAVNAPPPLGPPGLLSAPAANAADTQPQPIGPAGPQAPAALAGKQEDAPPPPVRSLGFRTPMVIQYGTEGLGWGFGARPEIPIVKLEAIASSISLGVDSATFFRLAGPVDYFRQTFALHASFRTMVSIMELSARVGTTTFLQSVTAGGFTRWDYIIRGSVGATAALRATRVGPFLALDVIFGETDPLLLLGFGITL